jgi:hypothetical protein
MQSNELTMEGSKFLCAIIIEDEQMDEDGAKDFQHRRVINSIDSPSPLP